MNALRGTTARNGRGWPRLWPAGRTRIQRLLCGLAVSLLPLAALGQPTPAASGAAPTQAPAEKRDGQHDFDFEVGTWKTRLKRRQNPLTGSTTWIEYEGTSVVRKVWDGRANLLELDVEGPAGRIEGLSLRLYNPESGQWSLNFSNSRVGTLTPPVIGGFRDGRGEFFGQESLNGRAIFVRFVITPVDPDTYRFEQSFSDDGGRTWETNWIATDTRVKAGIGD